MQISDRIFHISHNDLDGYGSQFIVSRIFYNVAYFNSDYKDIDYTINQAIKQIKMEILAAKPPKLLLITDVNLTLESAESLNKKIKGLPVKVDLKLIDHHATGKDCVKKFDWYHVDTTCCAARLTYQWLKPWLNSENDSYLDALSTLVNVTDLWLTDDPQFNLANLMSDVIFDRPLMIKEMEEYHRNYLFQHICEIFEHIQKGNDLETIERDFYSIRLNYLRACGIDEAIIDDKNISLEGKYHLLILKYLQEAPPPIINIEGYKVAIFFRWLGVTFQHVSSRYLEQHRHIDIAMRVGSNARLSMRSRKDNIDLGVLSRKYFNGGGHPQAAGGTLKVRQLLNMKEVSSQIQRAIKNNS